MTQNQLARLVGPRVAVASISSWERGVSRPSDTYLTALCKALGVRVADLYAEPDGAAI